MLYRFGLSSLLVNVVLDRVRIRIHDIGPVKHLLSLLKAEILGCWVEEVDDDKHTDRHAAPHSAVLLADSCQPYGAGIAEILAAAWTESNEEW